jgi:hypothetical protein
MERLTDEWKNNFPQRYETGRQFELEIIEELEGNGYTATLNPNEYGYWDIELDYLVIEAKARNINFTDYDTQLFPVNKLDFLQEMPIDAILIFKYNDGYFWCKARAIKTHNLKKEQVKSYSYHIPNTYFNKASSITEILGTVTRRRYDPKTKTKRRS